MIYKFHSVADSSLYFPGSFIFSWIQHARSLLPAVYFSFRRTRLSHPDTPLVDNVIPQSARWMLNTYGEGFIRIIKWLLCILCLQSVQATMLPILSSNYCTIYRWFNATRT